MLWQKIIVGDRERILVSRKGRFVSILDPGEYNLWRGLGAEFDVERFDVGALVFESDWAGHLVRNRPDVVQAYFVQVETGDRQVAIVTVDGRLARVIGPGRRVLLWRAAGQVAVELVEVSDRPEIPSGSLDAFARLGRDSLVAFSTVEDGSAGLLIIDNRVARTLAPGRYGFWTVAGAPRVETVDLRRQLVEVSGQEILTRDKVTLRVNITAEYQVVDPVRLRQSLRDFGGTLYRALQLAVRQTLAKRSLEEVLADRTDLDEAVAGQVRAELAEAGVRVGSIAIKDIVLPGEMREILNQVVAAEKQAQANLIRRREETAATRSLLNTAKLMEDNPILVRLKELETLERVVEKVDRVTVNNGLGGLLNELVSLRG
jgi:regulator of protease activity HflC (stomatin/prohibitin superfamily)